jgi:hypothetical protein
VIWIVGNSVAFRVENSGELAYTDILECTSIRGGHDTFFTVLGALHITEKIGKLKPDDWIIFNFGVNCCIYRKSIVAQTQVLEVLCKNIEKIDSSGYNFFKEKLEKFRTKEPDELVQLFTFEQFEHLLDRVFPNFSGNHAIVLSINWFSPENETFGWAYNEVIQVNKILREKAEQYEMHFVDLFKPEITTFDAVHLTQSGHEYVAKKIKEIINGEKK